MSDYSDLIATFDATGAGYTEYAAPLEPTIHVPYRLCPEFGSAPDADKCIEVGDTRHFFDGDGNFIKSYGVSETEEGPAEGE